MKVRSAPLASGVTLEYVEHGNQDGPPVLFVHGGTDSWHSFELVLPELPNSIRAFAVTLRGHGGSSKPATGYGYDDFAGDLVAFMDSVGLESAVIAGHSMGRAVAQRFAVHHPARASGLILMGSFAGEAGNPVVAELEKTVATFVDPVDPKFVREFQVSTLSRPVPADFLETVINESLKVPARVWRDLFIGIRDNDAASDLAKIRVPTLVLVGDKDDFAPMTEVTRHTASIPNGRLVVYPNAGHGLHWEEPARFAADVAAFTLDQPPGGCILA